MNAAPRLVKVEPMVRELVGDMMAEHGWAPEFVRACKRGAIDTDSYFATQAAQRAVNAERARASVGQGGASQQERTSNGTLI